MRRMTSALLVLSLLAISIGVGGIGGCASAADGAGGDSASELDTLPNGLRESSLEAEGTRILANDRAVGAETFVARAGLTPAAAAAIVAGRTDRQGKPHWFRTVTEVLELPGLDINGIDLLVRDAFHNGYVEKAGFDAPTAARLTMENANAHPRESDMTVESGFDGLGPDAVFAVVRARLTNVVHPSNESFVEQTIRQNHKAFTIAAWNLLSPGSPPAEFARRIGAEKLTLLGTMSAVHPTILLAERQDRKAYFARGDNGNYTELRTPPTYPVIMRVRIRLTPAGVRVHYPDWSAPVLSGPTSTIVEIP